MYREVFQSLNESIKRRNSPDSYLPPKGTMRDVIHRGYIKDATFPLRYDFIPDGKGTSNSGVHAYYFNNEGTRGVIEIKHRYAPKTTGHETSSKISFEMIDGKPLDSIDLHRMIVPALMHHNRSHTPDIIEFDKSISDSAEDLISRLGDKFEPGETIRMGETVRFVKRKLDPKISRVISHIKSKLNNNKG
jgi:hypothetical protein